MIDSETRRLERERDRWGAREAIEALDAHRARVGDGLWCVVLERDAARWREVVFPSRGAPTYWQAFEVLAYQARLVDLMSRAFSWHIPGSFLTIPDPE